MKPRPSLQDRNNNELDNSSLKLPIPRVRSLTLTIIESKIDEPGNPLGSIGRAYHGGRRGKVEKSKRAEECGGRRGADRRPETGTGRTSRRPPVLYAGVGLSPRRPTVRRRPGPPGKATNLFFSRQPETSSSWGVGFLR